jgi:hypothetical protein
MFQTELDLRFSVVIKEAASRACCLLVTWVYSLTLKMEATCSSETSVDI